VAALVAVVSIAAGAQTLINSVVVGSDPVAVAVNGATNKIFVANLESNNLTVIDGATYHTNTVTTGAAPNSVAVNPATNKIYVANSNADNVTVIDGNTYGTARVNVGIYPVAVAVNAVTNKIYVANEYSNNVTVIDGANNQTSTIGVSSSPVALAINPVSNKIYVANNGSNSVSIIDGESGSVSPVNVGVYPRAIAVDQITNTIFVANYGSNPNNSSLSVIDGITGSVSSVAVGSYPAAVAVNPVAGTVYVANSGSGTVTMVQEGTLATTAVEAGTAPTAIDIDPVTNKAYVANFTGQGTLTMIDGNTGSTDSILLGEYGIYPGAVVVNPTTNSVYVADAGGNSVSVVAGASSQPLQFVPVIPCRVADTRWPNGPFGGPFLTGGNTRNFEISQGGCGIPPWAQAYSLNITVVPVQGRLGYLTAWPTGEAQPSVSTLNSYDGRVKANAAIVPAGAIGAISIYVTDSTHVILDINGYFQAPDPTVPTLQFFPLTLCRVADTRNSHEPHGLGAPYLSGGAPPRTFPVLNATSCFPSGVNPSAYSLNVTAVPHGPLYYLTVWPAGVTEPNVSTLNAPTGTIVANAAIVPAGTGGAVNAFASNDTDMIIDVNGYFAAPAAGGLSLYASVPCRVIDTRGTGGAFNGQRSPPVNVAASACTVPATAQGYVFNATVVPVHPLEFLTLWPDPETMPYVSTLNAIDAAVTSNMAIVPNLDGSTDAYASGLTYLILDISSYFAP
jgi:YVTN family beta-propeller protein